MGSGMRSGPDGGQLPSDRSPQLGSAESCGPRRANQRGPGAVEAAVWIGLQTITVSLRDASL